MFKLYGFIISIGLSTIAIGQSFIFTPENEPVEVAASSFGNKAIRMVTNAADEPVLAFGSNGHLYVCAWDNASAAFGEPVEIDPDANVFMSDAEGPRMASQGDFVVLTYQISGEWANGARSVRSTDGGYTWSTPVAMVSGADADHFMPCVAIDNNGNPFAGVKVGNNSASIFEGILRSEDGGSIVGCPQSTPVPMRRAKRYANVALHSLFGPLVAITTWCAITTKTSATFG